MTAVSASGARPRDAAARDRAITATGRNLVVTAGAGTGKTALLVERAIHLVCGEGYAIDSIAAITFTEKAAAELRTRLASGLDEMLALATRRTPPGEATDATEAGRAWRRLAASGGKDPDRIRSRALEALVGLDGAPISTIHSFCSRILMLHPREAGVDPSFRTDEGTAFETIFREEWERFLLEEMGPKAPRVDLWRRVLLIPGALDSVHDLGRALASFLLPAEALSGGGRAAGPPADLFRDAAAALRDEANGVVARATGLNPNMSEFLSAAIELLDAFVRSGRAGMDSVTSPLSLEECVTREPAVGRKLAGVEPEEVEDLRKRATRTLKALRAVDEETVRSIIEAAAPLAARARERLLSSGFVTFDALLRLTRDLLAGHPGIRRSIAARFRTLLVDEFQDTDPLQYEILFFIAEQAGRAERDAYETELAPGSLFIVGDPKQSIYRFRGADMEAYRRAVDHVLRRGGERLTLTTSFRAPEEIVDPINTLFRTLIGPASDEERAAEPDYEPIDSARGPVATRDPRVEIWSIPAGDVASERRQAEAEAIARWLVEGAGRSSATGAPLRYGDVALLFRSLSNLGIYAQALRRAGIPFIVEGGKDFYERQEVREILALLRAAANPNDAPSALAVLRSSLGAASDVELARYATAGGRFDAADASAIDPERFPNVRRTFDLLRRFRAGMIGRPADEVVRSALEETPLALLHAATYEGAQRVANLRKLVVRAEELGRAGLSLEETLRFIEDEFESARSEGESPLADETIDAVRILSVHKAKGLEYPVVFVPDVGRRETWRPIAEAAAAWARRGAEGFLAARLAGGETNLAWAWRWRLERIHAIAEEKRVLYVACTRARERLILVNSNAERRRIPWRDSLAAVGYAAAGDFPAEGRIGAGRIEHRVIVPKPIEVAKPPAAIDPIWSAAAGAFVSVAGSAAAGAVPVLRWPSGARDSDLAEDASPAVEDAARTEPPGRRGGAASGGGAAADAARLAGTAVHAALQRWDFSSSQELRDAASSEARRIVEDEPALTSIDRGELGAKTTRETDSIVEDLLSSDLPSRLRSLQSEGRIIGREVPVLFRDDEGTTWLGSCDLIYREADGRTVVVADYKTDRLEPGREAEAAAAAAAAAAERYRDQIHVYAEAIRRLLPGSSVRAEIIFVRSGKAVAMEGAAKKGGRAARGTPEQRALF